MSQPEIIVEENSGELAETAARRFVDIVSARQTESGVARVALSGGSTPRALFKLLADDPFATRIDWNAVDVFWGDERTVPPEHEDSNYRMARETLLSHVPIPKERIHRMRGELEPNQAADDYECAIRSVFTGADASHPPVFDLILLGIGDDGHCASLFPGTSALSIHDRLVVANPVPQQHTTRLSFTIPVLQSARNVLFLVSGSGKAWAVHLAIEGTWDPVRTPSQYLREAHGQVVWMLDADAASQLHDSRDG